MNINFNLIKKYFEPRTILDIGAHVGEFNMFCNYYFPNSYILSIEGNKDCEEALKAKNINYLICLLGDENKKTIFYKNNDCLGTGHSIYKELTRHYDEQILIKEELDLKTLDFLFEKNNINVHFDLIKIDTQGSEIDILKGAKNTIKNTKGILLEVSYKPYNENAPLEYEVIKYMENIGFLLKEELDNNPNVGQRDLLFIRE
jgi:FkbM family methyltransferase